MSTRETISHLSSRLAELAVEIFERQQEIGRLQKEHDALQMALKTVEGICQNPEGDPAAEGLTFQQRIVFENIPLGWENALQPSVIARQCPSLEADYVRKTLRRLSDYGRIETEDSLYWREE